MVAVEEPLKIRIGDDVIATTMRTPGNDEELATGFLFTEGLLHQPEDIVEISGDDDSVTLPLARAVDAQFALRRYNPYWDGVYGRAAVDLLIAAGCSAPPPGIPTVDTSIILRLPETLRDNQPIFDRTGGLHAAALFDNLGNLKLVREDVGRHNAVDKLLGRSLLDGRVPLKNSVLLVSGCASFAMVQKAMMAGVPVLVALGAPFEFGGQGR
jgi:FdhD protein